VLRKRQSANHEMKKKTIFVLGQNRLIFFQSTEMPIVHPSALEKKAFFFSILPFGLARNRQKKNRRVLVKKEFFQTKHMRGGKASFSNLEKKRTEKKRTKKRIEQI